MYIFNYPSFHFVGTGLGLSITHDIIKAHVGSLEIQFNVEKRFYLFSHYPEIHWNRANFLFYKIEFSL
ncbi:MAG: hypothetical protein EA359_07210 [Balneolaceae bacterium]|nr:MAG: hypothetical protein EA359_07210 [Balneolaceae bacterium]